MLIIRNSSRGVQRCVDFVCIIAGWLLAQYLAVILSRRGMYEFPRYVDWHAQYRTLLLMGLLAWTGITTYTDTYHSHRAERLPYVAGLLMRTLLMWALITTAGAFAFKLRSLSRQFAAYFFGAAGLLIFARQIATIVVMRRLRRFGYNWRAALIIGDRAACDRFASLLTTAHPMGYRVAVMPDGGAGAAAAAPPDHARLSLALNHVDEVFIVGGERGARGVE